MTSFSTLSLFVLAVTSSLAASQNVKDKGRVVCYYEQWAIYRGSGGTFAPKDINPYLCTHLIYSFAEAVVEGATLKSADENADFARNGFRDFIDLRTKYNEDLKVLLAIGGYNSGSRQFTPISAKPGSRQAFALNSLEYLRRYGFDGLNIDWQFPNDQARSGDAEDYKNFPLLLKDIEKVFEEEAAATGKPKLLLTISVPGKTDIIEPGYDLPELQKYVEFMNVLCYDYHYAYDPYVFHHSPIYPLPDEVAGSGHENEGLNADATINYILSKGVQADKLNLGIPLYGRGFTLEDENAVTLGSAATGQGAEGKATRETGYKAYFELCKDLENGYTIVRHNETALGPFAYKGNQWVGYDDEESVRRKGEYAKKKGLGGISFWAIDQDDFNAICGTRAYPLIKAAREGYIRAQKPTSAPKAPSTAPQIASATPISSNEGRPSPSVQRPISHPSVNMPSKRPAPQAKMPAEATSNTGQRSSPSDLLLDYDDGVVYDAATSSAKASTPNRTPATTDAPSGMVQNVYIWITNNIFHHSPPHYVDSSVQSSKHGPSSSATTRPSPPATTPGINQGHPEVGSSRDILGRMKYGVESSNIAAPSQVPSDTGTPTQVPSNTGAPSQVPSDTRAPSQVPSDTGAPSQVSSDTGAPSQVPSETGGPSQVPSDTRAPSQVPSDTGAPSQVPSDTGTPHVSSATAISTESTLHTNESDESSQVEITVGQSPGPELSTEGLLNNAEAAVTASSTDVSVVHVSSEKSSSLIYVSYTFSTPKRYKNYYNGVPVWTS